MADRSRLAAVESLVERRLAAERAERRRREDREQDEVATDLWRRGRALAATAGGAR
jgi:flagellar protein FliJ